MFGATSLFGLTGFQHSSGCPQASSAPAPSPSRFPSPHISPGLLGSIVHSSSLPHSCLKPWFLGLIPTPQSVIKRHPISTHRLWRIFTPLPNAGETPRAVNYRLLSLSSRNLPCCDSLQSMPSAALHCSPTALTETGGVYPPNPAPFPFRATYNRRTRLRLYKVETGHGKEWR